MRTYKLTPDFNGRQNNVVIRDDGTQIPFDEANSDYQEFLRWCELGNAPLPADEV